MAGRHWLDELDGDGGDRIDNHTGDGVAARTDATVVSIWVCTDQDRVVQSQSKNVIVVKSVSYMFECSAVARSDKSPAKISSLVASDIRGMDHDFPFLARTRFSERLIAVVFVARRWPADPPFGSLRSVAIP